MDKLTVAYYRPSPSGLIQRYFKGAKQFIPDTFGGETHVAVTVGGNFFFAAKATCRPDENFCYKYGRGVAAKRIIDRVADVLDEEVYFTLRAWADEVPEEWEIQ